MVLHSFYSKAFGILNVSSPCRRCSFKSANIELIDEDACWLMNEQRVCWFYGVFLKRNIYYRLNSLHVERTKDYFLESNGTWNQMMMLFVFDYKRVKNYDMSVSR